MYSSEINTSVYQGQALTSPSRGYTCSLEMMFDFIVYICKGNIYLINCIRVAFNVKYLNAF